MNRFFGQHVVALILPAIVLTGCRTFTNPGEVSSVAKSNAVEMKRISWDATRRGTYVIVTKDSDGKDQVVFVAEPPPDATLDTLTKLVAKATPSATGGTGIEGSLDVTETAKAITRAAEVSFLRDSLYRLSEAHANKAITSGEYAARFDKIVQLTTLITLSNQSGTSEEVKKVLLAIFEKMVADAEVAVVAKEAERDQLTMVIEAKTSNAAPPTDVRLPAELMSKTAEELRDRREVLSAEIKIQEDLRERLKVLANDMKVQE